MTAFARKVAELIGVPAGALERLSGGDLSEVLLFRRPDGRCTVAKGGASVSAEAAMLRRIAGLGVPAPLVEGEHGGVLLLEYLENDRVFSANAWASVGAAVRKLHDALGDDYGWPVDYSIGSVAIDNRQGSDWRRFWFEQRLEATAALLDRPWRERVAGLRSRIDEILPERPQPSLLHGDLWGGNILVARGELAGLIDPACYHGHNEVDLAMLTLFDAPSQSFWDAYGALEPGADERRPAYQLFPALLHLRLFGESYAPLADRLFRTIEG